MTKETHISTINGAPQGLQEYGVGVFSVLETKSSFKKALKKNLIKVNGTLATTATLIFGGETIEFQHELIIKKIEARNTLEEMINESLDIATTSKSDNLLQAAGEAQEWLDENEETATAVQLNTQRRVLEKLIQRIR